MTVVVPGYWRNETSGVLRPAVHAYLNGDAMTPDQIGAMRAYLRQWMQGSWSGPAAETLRKTIDEIVDRPCLEGWLRFANEHDIDPL